MGLVETWRVVQERHLITHNAPMDHPLFLEQPMSQRFTEINLGKFERTPSPMYKKSGYGAKSEPFVIYFVYSKEGAFVVKGMSSRVESYVYQRFPRCVYRYTMWSEGKSRGGWNSTMCVYIRPVENDAGKRRCEISVYNDKKCMASIDVRRVPKKWLSIYDMASAKERRIR